MVNLQDIDCNLNPFFSGKIDPQNDFFAFVDESGDEGFMLNKNGVSQWFNVTALISTPKNISDMVDFIVKFKNSRCPQKNLVNMSAKELKHQQRKDLFLGLSKYEFITTHSLFYKPGIDPSDRLVTYPSMYFVGVKNIIERITWCTKQYGKKKTHILISNRNSINAQDLKKYLFDTSIKANANLSYKEKIGIVKLANFGAKKQFLLADYAAFTLRMLFEESGDPPCSDPYYFTWFQKGKLFSSSHGLYHGIWGNGLKLTPPDKTLIKNSDILNEGSHKD